jgi:DNA-binding NtrC family response regulator
MAFQGRILIVDDEANIRDALREALAGEGYHIDVAEDGQAAINRLKRASEPYNVVVTDLMMPHVSGLDVLDFVKKNIEGTDVILITAYATVSTAVKALKEGAEDYLTKPLELIHFRVMIQKLLEKQRLVWENAELREMLKLRGEDELVIGTSRAIRSVYAMIDRVADSDVTVLIEGESGTGKDVAARVIHQRSRRRDKPFIIINCGALPETLLENELFGHEKDAYTGATSLKRGRFELAHGGTLFLDEVTEMGTNSQADFLRVLEDGIIYRIGGSAPIQVDVRVIAATNRNLKQAVESGDFREDLYYRLNVVAIRMPRLRERKEDIPVLVDCFLREFAIKYRKPPYTVPDDTMQLLLNYPWPGNVRELRNVLERAVILGKGPEILPKNFPPSLQMFQAAPHKIELEVGMPMNEVERVVIKRTLESVGGHRRKAAEILNISLRSLQYKLKEYRIDV